MNVNSLSSFRDKYTVKYTLTCSGDGKYNLDCAV